MREAKAEAALFKRFDSVTYDVRLAQWGLLAGQNLDEEDHR